MFSNNPGFKISAEEYENLESPLIEKDYTVSIRDLEKRDELLSSSRSCTDVLCVLILYTTWILMTAIGVYASLHGDYRVVLSPMDYDGNICGTDHGSTDMTDYKYLYYVNPLVGGVCVRDCPVFDEILVDMYTLVTFGGVWQVEGKTELPKDYIKIADYSNSLDVKYCNEESCYPGNDTIASYNSTGINGGYGYAFYAIDTTPILNRCVPNIDSLKYIRNVTNSTEIDDSGTKTDYDQGLHALSISSEILSDIWIARAYIFGFGSGVSIVLGFLYSHLLRSPFVPILVWGSILGTITILIASGAYGIDATLNGEVTKYTDERKTFSLVLASVLIFLGILGLCVTCALRKSIVLAMGCTQAAASAINRMPRIIFLPVLQSICYLIFLFVFFIFAVEVASFGDLVSQTITVNDVDIKYRSFEYDDNIIYAAFFLLFCLIWTSDFIVALGTIIISMSMSTWYFTRDKSKIGNKTVIKSIRDTLYYHQGTAACGSLLIACVRPMKNILLSIRATTSDTDNSVLKAVASCCGCAFWWLENFLLFIDKNAYVQTAIFGHNYCNAAREAFSLIIRNAGRIGTISYVSGIFSIVGRLLITASTAFGGYFLMNAYIKDDVHSLYGPVIIISILAYVVADVFMDIFDVGVSTILQCFVVDEETYDGDECYAEAELKTWLEQWEEPNDVKVGDEKRRPS